MDLIQKQASALWELIFSEETAETYQDALNLTGNILKETAQLLWLIICSVFVFGAWLGDTSMKTGNGVRSWIDNQGNPTVAEDKKPLTETGKDLLDTGRSGINYLLNQAREQLGLDPAPPVEVKKKAKPQAAATPAATPTAPAAVTQPAASTGGSAAQSSGATAAKAATSAPQASASSSAEEEPEISRESDDGGWPPQDIDS